MNFDKQFLLNWAKRTESWLDLLHWLAGVLLTYWLALALWIWVDVLWPAPQPKLQLPRANVSSAKPMQFDVSRLVERHLFGQTVMTEAAPQVISENVPETRLNLKLRGIYAAQDNKRANAIIEDDRGRQAVYFIGDQLKVTGQVYLRAVEANRVVLETNGRREVLTLKEENARGVVPEVVKTGAVGKLRAADNSDSKKVLDRRKDQRLSQELNRYRDQLRDNPLSFRELVNARPALKNGQMVGIRISPGKNRRLFSQLGLRRNDVVTSINGVQLNNMQEAMSLYAGLDSMDSLEVSILRGNEELSLLLDLNPAQNDPGIQK